MLGHLPLHAEEIALYVCVAKILIEHREIRERRVESLALQRWRDVLKHLRNRRQIVGRAGQVETGKGEIVGANILPKVVERTIVEDAVCATHDGSARPGQVVGEAEARRPVITIRLVNLFVARGRINELRVGDSLGEAGS